MLYYMQLTLSKIYIFYFSTFFVVVAGTAVYNMDYYIIIWYGLLGRYTHSCLEATPQLLVS